MTKWKNARTAYIKNGTRIRARRPLGAPDLTQIEDMSYVEQSVYGGDIEDYSDVIRVIVGNDGREEPIFNCMETHAADLAFGEIFNFSQHAEEIELRINKILANLTEIENGSY